MGEVPAPAEEIHSPRPLAILIQAHVSTLQRRGSIPCSCRSSCRPAGRHTRSNCHGLRPVEGLLVHPAHNIQSGWAATMRAIGGRIGHGTHMLSDLPCMKRYLSVCLRPHSGLLPALSAYVLFACVLYGKSTLHYRRLRALSSHSVK